MANKTYFFSGNFGTAFLSPNRVLLKPPLPPQSIMHLLPAPDLGLVLYGH